MRLPVDALRAAILQKPTPSNVEAFLLNLDERVTAIEQLEKSEDEEDSSGSELENTELVGKGVIFSGKQMVSIDVYKDGEFIRTRFVDVRKIEQAIGAPL